jgi:hypothetical protein
MNRVFSKTVRVPKNVLFMLKDWKRHPIIETLPPSEQIKFRTQWIELETKFLIDMNELFMTHGLNYKEMSEQMRIRVSRLADESGLYELFEKAKNPVAEHNGNRGQRLAN